jgi:uncharacterized protein
VTSYSLHIQGLSNNLHHFLYDFGDEFFRHYGTSLVEKGHFRAEIDLNKHDTFIEATFRIRGFARLTCDRSLDEFDYPLNIERKMIFKFGDDDREVDDTTQMIAWGTDSLELGQFIYEFIGLEVPIKKLHPRYLPDDEPDGIVYRTHPDPVDPRWEILKKLTDN